MAITVELRQLGDQPQVRPKPLIRIVLSVLDGLGRDPSVLVVYTVPVYGQSGLRGSCVLPRTTTTVGTPLGTQDWFDQFPLGIAEFPSSSHALLLPAFPRTGNS
jgi:hypothetical protein